VKNALNYIANITKILINPSTAASTLVIAACVLSANAQAETLKQIYQLAAENDHQLKADRAAYFAEKETVNISRSALLPQIGGTAQYTDIDRETNGPISTGTGFANGTSDTDIDSTSYSISLTQALFDRSAWYVYKQGKTASYRAEVQYAANQQSLIIRVAEAYFNVLSAIDQLTTSEAEQKALAQQLEQTRQRYEVGLISINDVHDAQAAFDSATANTLAAKGNLGITFDELGVLTGQDHQWITPLKKSFPVTPPVPADVDAWVKFALENNYPLKISQLTADVARFNTKAKTSDHLPTLSGSISYEDSSFDQDVSTGSNNTDTSTDTDETTISLELTIPIYSGGNISASRRQAYQQEIQAQEDYRFTRRNTIQSARSLHLSVITDIAQVKARQQAIVSNQSSLDATQAGYDAGTRDIVDVVNAQRNLFQAQRDYFTSLYNYVVNTLKLKEAAGILTPEDLDKLEAWLNAEAPVDRRAMDNMR